MNRIAHTPTDGHRVPEDQHYFENVLQHNSMLQNNYKDLNTKYKDYISKQESFVRKEWNTKFTKFMMESSPLRSAKKSLIDEGREARFNKELELKNMQQEKADGNFTTQNYKLYLDPNNDTEVNKAKLAMD